MSLSGTVNDPELLNIYGGEILLKTKNLLDKCKLNGWRIATAESLTGGGISTLLSALGGSSSMLDRGYTVYNNDAKAEMLGVSRVALAQYEAVSEPVAIQMAKGALERSNANISVAVTGYASESGDEQRNIPGGTVFIAVSYRMPGKHNATLLEVKEHHFSTERTACRQSTITEAINGLGRALEKLAELPSPETSGELSAAGSSAIQPKL